MAYLIACSSSKRIPIENNLSKISNLSYSDELLNARMELIELTGIELDWNKTLPAWKLYSGNRSVIYNRVKEVNWKNPKTNVKILSALFGWINHDDLIPFYDLSMTERKNQIMPYLFWRKKNKLSNYILSEDIDLLSKNYKKAISNNGIIKAINPNIIWEDPKGLHKGRWLNAQLNLL